VNQSKLTLAGK